MPGGLLSWVLLSTVSAFAGEQSNALSQKYTVYDLGPAGNPFSSGSTVNDHGVVVGSEPPLRWRAIDTTGPLGRLPGQAGCPEPAHGVTEGGRHRP